MIARVSTILTLTLIPLFALSCGGKCTISGECDQGQHCDFVRGKCLMGCTRDSECGPEAQCSTRFGTCQLKGSPGPASTSTAAADAATSTAGDAGKAD